LYLLHAPYGGKDGRLGAWKALVEAVDAGKVRSIGVSNYGVHHLEELEAYIKEIDLKEGQGKGGVLSVNQVELHPWLSRPDIVSWCEKRGVVLEVSAMVLGIGTEVRHLALAPTLTFGIRRIAPSFGLPEWMSQKWSLWRRNMAKSRRKYCCGGGYRR